VGAQRAQFDLQVRIPAAAQVSGIKHQQVQEFLDLVGTGSPTTPTSYASKPRVSLGLIIHE
jgi:hypothetical protein